MNIDSIKSTIQAIPSNAKTAVNSVGESTINSVKSAGSFIKEHAPQTIKNIKKPQAVDDFVSSAKKRTPNFLKEIGKFIKKNKNIIAGTAVIVAAVASAISIIKAIVNKVKEAKAEKLSMHQG